MSRKGGIQWAELTLMEGTNFDSRSESQFGQKTKRWDGRNQSDTLRKDDPCRDDPED